MKTRKSIFRFIIMSLLLLVTTRVCAVGWTPTEAGLLVNLQQGDRFMLSVWIDLNKNGDEDPGEEFFVHNYNRFTGGYFNYSSGLFLKLLPATEITEMNVWAAGAPLDRGKYALDGTTYTIWNDGKTLRMDNDFQFLGNLTSNYADQYACDVVFVIPTELGVPTVDKRTLPSFDPNNTLGKGKAPFNGATGTGFLGMTYREVYMFDVPRKNNPISYTNASLVTFNTTLQQKKWSNNQITCDPGHAAYAFADEKHDKTTRTIFRLYLLDKPFVNCQNTYFFATDSQNVVSYRKVNDPKTPRVPSEWTTPKKIYTMDYMTRLARVGDTTLHRTSNIHIPVSDSTYYYVGYNNDYKTESETMGTPGAHSEFTKIRELPLATLPEFKAPAGAYGSMIIDSTSTADNHAVKFEPAGYFLKVKTGTNVRMHQTTDSTWTSEEMWTITDQWALLHIQTMLMTGPEFRDDDPGAAVEGWTKWVRGDSVPVSDGSPMAGSSGYAQINIHKTDSNGHMVFILADKTKWLYYDNNGFMGLQMPLQYPLAGNDKVVLMAPRIKPEYTFLGWNTKADGSGDTLKIGDSYTLTKVGADTLYALAKYEGTLQMAISFKKADGKRYFLTHPNTSAPRYAHTRYFADWENTWQGMADAENSDPNYLSTFELRCPVKEIKKKAADVTEDLKLQEHVLDPRHYTMKGYKDSLTFYEYFAPNHDEYLGLYYERSMNTVLANNTWAGLFTTTSNATELSWPNYKVPYIDSTKIKSERYVEEYDPENKKDSLILKNRKDGTGWLPAFVKYNSAEDRFDGVADETDGTDFQISAVIVADEHYIIVPDTTHAWNDTIEFTFHQDEQLREEVWSSLIGKQLMAVMFVDGDTVYFHPNRNKIISDPNNLYLSPDFRVSQVFEFIPDARVSAPLNEGDSAKHETTDYHWHNDIVSGLNSPLNVTDAGGNYIDVVDTFRITISHDAISKIKEYRGLWKKGAAGLKVDNASGSARHRDIIVRTKTYHEGAISTRLVLEPEFDRYSFSPLEGVSRTINFTLVRETFQSMLDINDEALSTRILSRDTVKNTLALTTAMCSLKGSAFIKGTIERDYVTLTTEAENTLSINYDTLTVTTTKGDTVVTAQVPLMQAALSSRELLWSVVDGGKRYFILAKEDGLIFRQYNVNNSIMYKEGSKTAHLILGSKDAANSDKQYITPWYYTYTGTTDQLTLDTKSPIGKAFAVVGSTPTVGDPASPTAITYELVNTYTNANANYEEQVKLQIGEGQWLKFTGGNTPSLSLVNNEANASLFSWSYLVQEYSLLNNGTYPDKESLTFGYNVKTPDMVQTRYKAYKEYSTLLDNKVHYLCRKEQTNIDTLRDGGKEWLTDMTFTLLRDARFGAEKDSSKLAVSTNMQTLTTTVSTDKDSPIGTKFGGEYVNIVDTLDVRLSLQSGAPVYRFKGDWSKFKSVEDAHLKIPLIRRTYHVEDFDSLYVASDNDQHEYVFPSKITAGANDSCVFTLSTMNQAGTQLVNTDGLAVWSTSTTEDVSATMDLANKSLAEVRLMDIYGNTPKWCHIRRLTKNSIVVECTENGIRSPRTAYLYLAYIVMIDRDGEGPEEPAIRFVNDRLAVTQLSLYTYSDNQVLVHTNGASGDELMANGMQQVHENRRILYYYPVQDVELPVRERAFYGWWRWYREGKDTKGNDVSNSDVPDSLWRKAPSNTGKYNFPFRIIGDSVMLKKKDGSDSVKVLMTMGRYTVFHYRSKDYGNKNDPPSKNPRVAPPDTAPDGSRTILTYVADISNYYDRLPLSLKDKNQVDVAMMDTMREIYEPTLSLREVFELHPWTEMAEKMENYKSRDAATFENEKYMEDHIMMAPISNPLLLRTEQRYNYEHLAKHGHSESMLGYYMRDDKWSEMSAEKDEDGWSRQDSMVWCGGWDADCLWYTYDPSEKTYTLCKHTVTEEEDFLKVPAVNKIPSDTVYYCLRARSKKTLTAGTAGNPDPDKPLDGDYWFNICRYKIVYHDPNRYGPKLETTAKSVTKAIMTNEEIEQRYDVLERLDFDYIKPGPDYHVYPHPLPWADASYGYTYPETSDLPHNRYHDESDFPNHGEYGLINRIPYSTYWHKMEQHGGASNGYMIYCDGMASAGQVAALSLSTHLCAGQKMFFSGYVGNPSNQKQEKSKPNFIFSVEGSIDGEHWEDITSYMTGDIPPKNQWYQIYFPIIHNKGNREFEHFRVRIYNVASSFDGNDFVIDDMCIFATKPPLIAYQGNTTCKEYGKDDGDTHVLLRIDYQGITGEEAYNNADVCYTVRQMTPDSAYSFVPMSDKYIKEDTAKAVRPAQDTIYGKIFIPAKTYEPQDEDSIYRNMNQLIDKFDRTWAEHVAHPEIPIVREGYIYEILEGDIRPVKYVVHSARMDPANDYTIHMSGDHTELLNSICGMTSHLKVSNRMVLELNGEEQPEVEVIGLCVNSTYDISMRVKGTMYRDSIAPIDVEGSCVNDWLVYGDTARASSKARYGYYYKDIVAVIKDILRYAPRDYETNGNQFAKNFAEINKAELERVQREYFDSKTFIEESIVPYDMIKHLVDSGYLILYKPKMTTTVTTGDVKEFVILPIVGTGSKAVVDARVEVCPNPVHIKLEPTASTGVPLMVGGLRRSAAESVLPVNKLVSESKANLKFKLRVDSIMSNVGIYEVKLRSTDDPGFIEGMHTLRLQPDKRYPSDNYYRKGDSITFVPAAGNTYRMKAGYNYTYDIVMQDILGRLETDSHCEIGTIPFILSIVPDYIRWEPKSATNNNWNDADNWIGIDANNEPIHNEAHFVPMENTFVLIPAPEEGKPYPVVQPIPAEWKDSIQKVGFQYNQCNAIRFLPGAAIGQQQLMNYTEAVVDMDFPNQKWAFRTAPVEGMLSGDLYMANADNNNETPLWEVGEFDANGRSYKTGNASFWLSVYSRETIRKNNVGQEDSTRTAAAEWSKVTNALTLPLPPGQGWAVYARTATKKDAVVRQPKTDDIYYYYGTYGERLDNLYEPYLQNKRREMAGDKVAGQLTFRPTADYDSLTLTNEAASTSFVFGNPTMGYIDIWGFIADNRGEGKANISEQFGYLDESNAKASHYRNISKSAAAETENKLSNMQRYLPPMRVMVLTVADSATVLKLRLNTNRVITDPEQVVRSGEPSSAPRQSAISNQQSAISKGIMTITAINPCSPRCQSRVLLGQGYNDAILDGEDAVLTTINIDNYNTNTTPTTPFNMYALEDGNGLSIDLRNEILNVPLSFCMSELPYDPVTHLWFTGVNNIDGPLVLYDAWADTERMIMDGICITIETPEISHQARYYIRRFGFDPDNYNPGTTTGIDQSNMNDEQVLKFIYHGQVYILRNGHIYTMMGQKVR